MELHCIESFFEEIELIGNSHGSERKVEDIDWWSKEDADEDEGIINMRDLEDETFEKIFSSEDSEIPDTRICSGEATTWEILSDEDLQFDDLDPVSSNYFRSCAGSDIDEGEIINTFREFNDSRECSCDCTKTKKIVRKRDDDSDKENKLVNPKMRKTKDKVVKEEDDKRGNGRVWGLKLFEEFEQKILREGTPSYQQKNGSCKDNNSNCYDSEDHELLLQRDSSKDEISKRSKTSCPKGKKRAMKPKETVIGENKSDVETDVKRSRQSERIYARKKAVEEKRTLKEVSNTFENTHRVTRSRKAKIEENLKTVQIFCLHSEETESSILERYGAFGNILQTKLSISRQGNMIGFVTYEDATSAAKCMKYGNSDNNLLHYDMQIKK
ncbi:PREDICTED: uncharacterized protein LOC108560110 isoform X2 [Nicrophorus vespilloides]|uniref:Uncharacterized protein LOC108560110 isoform X2 n=1 Tax=Nicrophorus vespilloides TaxID=110193 RepID=A0ABM1MEQ1_NICVS|nr:PREDICTED: uncharacterized protein LOC108560110 isoform X2 [Nicrophorus vespilloides]